MLTGQRLELLTTSHAQALERFERANRDFFAAAVGDRGDTFFAHFDELLADRVAENREGVSLLFVVVDAAGEIVGRVNITDIDQPELTELGFRIAEDAQGHAVATVSVDEALRIAASLGVSDVKARAAVENHGSRRVLDRCGFVMTGPADSPAGSSQPFVGYRRHIGAGRDGGGPAGSRSHNGPHASTFGTWIVRDAVYAPCMAATDDTSTFTIAALSPDTWEAFADLADRHNGVWGGCYCTWFHPDDPAKKQTAEGNRALKERWVNEGVAHAALVFDGDVAIAWAEYGTPEELPNLHHRKQYEATMTTPPDYRITCYFVDRRYRRRGVAAIALRGAVELIAAAGGGVVEGYPHDLQGAKSSASFLYGATRTMYEDNGFTYDRPKGQKNCVMTRTVAPAAR